MSAATLRFEAAVEGRDSVMRMVCEDLAGPQGGARATFWWRALDAPDAVPPPIVDAFVVPLALYAQMHGQDLRVRAPMSREGLFNLGQLLQARHAMANRGAMPRVIGVEPDSVTDPTRAEPDPAAAISFSGGLDSTFAAVRHGLGLRGAASYRLGALVMVHGTDAPLSDAEGFAGMLRRAEPLARRIGVPLRPVATDTMRFGRSFWPQQATPLVIAAMAMFTDRIGIGIIGGGASYRRFRAGVAHPPIFDQFCSNALLRVVTDGVELDRAAKIEPLLSYPDMLATVKICAGSMRGGGDSSRNCGRCEKCLSTWLSFRALGIHDPTCFDARPDEALIAHEFGWTDAFSKGGFLTMPLDDAVDYGATGPWVDRMRRVVATMPPGYFARDVARALVPRSARDAIRRGLRALRGG